MMYFETERLVFRDWEDRDFEPFAVMNADPDVMRYFPAPLNMEQSQDFLRLIQAEIRDKGYGLWPVELKQGGVFIGYIGLHDSTFESSFTPCIEIGWRLLKEHWHLGFATEGARGVLDYAKRTLGFKEIYSFTTLNNHSSESVMQKIGMGKVGEFIHPRLPEGHELAPHVLYRIMF